YAGASLRASGSGRLRSAALGYVLAAITLAQQIELPRHPVLDLARMQSQFFGDRRCCVAWLIRSTYGFPAKILSICMPLLGHDAPPARGYPTIEGVYCFWVTRTHNAVPRSGAGLNGLLATHPRW